MESAIPINSIPDGSKRPIARNRILSVRFTESEYAALENLAWSKGTTLADWAREALGHSLGNGGSEQTGDAHLH